jgi:hypothetical protein
MTNCCNEYGDCNQGRNCPARTAKVGQRYPAPAPLPPSTLPQQMRQIAKWVLVCIVTLWLASLVMALASTT